MPDLSVLVVGAGPTGLVLAIELARRGIAFRLIDRNPEPLVWDRATVLKCRTLEVLDHMGLAPIFLRRGVAMPTLAFFEDGAQVATVEFSDLDTPFPFLLSLPESETESILAEHLADLGGVVERGVELTELTQDAADVRASLRRISDGGEEILTADWVVGTDGLHSSVRAAVCDTFDGHDNPTLHGVVDVRLEGWRHDGNQTAKQLEAPGALLIPLRDGRWRIYYQPEADPVSLTGVAQSVASLSPGATIADHDLPRVFQTHSRIAPRFRNGRVFLAGDAAHVCSPLEGHGLNMGMQDAHNLGWKLALVVDGHAGPELLDTYEEERRPVDEAVVSSGDAAERRAVLQDPEVRRALVAELATEDGNRRAAMGEAEIAHSYPRSRLDDEIGGAERATGKRILVGQHLSDVDRLQLRGGAGRLYDLLRTPVHTLLVMSAEADPDEALRLSRAAAARYGAQLSAYAVTRRPIREVGAPPDLVGDPSGALHALLAFDEPSLCLIRPDMYLGFRCNRLSLDSLDAHLTRTFGSVEGDGAKDTGGGG